MGKYAQCRRTDNDIIRMTARSFADFGEAQTVQYIDGLTKRLQWLADNPNVGRLFAHRETGTHYFYFRYVSHVIYYRQRKNDIFIVRILHKKMLPEKHL